MSLEEKKEYYKDKVLYTVVQITRGDLPGYQRTHYTQWSFPICFGLFSSLEKANEYVGVGEFYRIFIKVVFPKEYSQLDKWWSLIDEPLPVKEKGKQISFRCFSKRLELI